jgi:hypothetical protein
LSQGMLRLMQDDALVSRLCSEIAARRFRTWRAYARSLADDMASVLQAEAEAAGLLSGSVLAALAASLVGSQRRSGMYSLPGTGGNPVTLTIDTGCAAGSKLEREADPAAPHFHIAAVDTRSLDAGRDVERAARSSLCLLENGTAPSAFIERAREQGCRHMLPDIFCAKTDYCGLQPIGRSVAAKNTRAETAHRGG